MGEAKEGRVEDSAFIPLSEYAIDDEPDNIIWHIDERGRAQTVLEAGTVCILSGEGGIGKSTITLSIAYAAAKAYADENMRVGRAAGLFIEPTKVCIISYDDGPHIIRRRLEWYGGGEEVAANIALLTDKEPLWTAEPFGRGGKPGGSWKQFWEEVREHDLRLVIIDPASVAFDADSMNSPGPIRQFLCHLEEEAKPRGEWQGCGVLLVAHPTKAARDEMRAGALPGEGLVQGSSAWYDGARGVLGLYQLVAHTKGRGGGQSVALAYDKVLDEPVLILKSVKSDYGRCGWQKYIVADYDQSTFERKGLIEFKGSDPDVIDELLDFNWKERRIESSTREELGLPTTGKKSKPKSKRAAPITKSNRRWGTGTILGDAEAYESRKEA